ncbi:MAG: TetR/AcrR family transcriptional regulator [Planctomycetota bacterium]
MSEPTAHQLFAPHEPVTTTRERIIAAAVDLFAEEGFHAVGLDRIIQTVGVTKTTFYNHFASKDELAIAAIQTLERWETHSFMQLIESLSDGSPRSTILACFDALDRWFTDIDYRRCLFTNACIEFPNLHDPVHQAGAEHFANIVTFFQEHAEAANADDPEAVAHQLELLIAGAMTIRTATGDPHTAARARPLAEALLNTALP